VGPGGAPTSGAGGAPTSSAGALSGAARGASAVEQMVRRWEDEELAVKKLMQGQREMLVELASGNNEFACLGPVLARHNPATPVAPPLTPDHAGAGPREGPAGVILTPVMNLISSSPSVRASPAMRRTMESLMARQQSIWAQVAETLGSRVASMLQSPKPQLRTETSSSAAAALLQSELPKLPPIRESVSIVKSIYANPTSTTANKHRKGGTSPKPPARAQNTNGGGGGGGGGGSSPPGSPMRTLPSLDAAHLSTAQPTSQEAAATTVQDTAATTATKRKSDGTTQGAAVAAQEAPLSRRSRAGRGGRGGTRGRGGRSARGRASKAHRSTRSSARRAAALKRPEWQSSPIGRDSNDIGVKKSQLPALPSIRSVVATTETNEKVRTAEPQPTSPPPVVRATCARALGSL
jgi:hypothetical protein